VTLVVGTDEAGYGPNLGPLVVAATAWEVAAAADDVDGVFTAVAADLAGLWGDSKQIFRGGAGLSALERGVLAAAGIAMGSLPATWRAFAAALAASHPADGPPAAAVAEHAEVAALLVPRACSRQQCLDSAAVAGGHLAARGVDLRAVQFRIIQPREFNALLDAGFNQSDILSRATLDLAAALVSAAKPGPVVVWCDRHGGRRRYAPLVSHSFAAPLVQVVAETPEWSAYHLPAATCRIEFSVRGESRLPVALASMTAKYARELSMAAFNEHWCGRQVGLRPTAGYPVDAARWRSDADETVRGAGLAWDDLWRRA